MVSIVADTNVLISALIAQGFEREVIYLVSTGKIKLYFFLRHLLFVHNKNTSPNVKNLSYYK